MFTPVIENMTDAASISSRGVLRNGAPARAATSASPVASTTRLARTASRPDLLSVMTPRTAPSSTIGATARRWSIGVIPASSTSTSATYLNRSPLMPIDSDWLSGLAAPIAAARSSSSRPMPSPSTVRFVAVPADALDPDLGHVPAEAAVAVEERRLRAGPSGRERSREAARAAADDEDVGLVDDVDLAGRCRGTTPQRAGGVSGGCVASGTAKTGAGRTLTRTAVPGVRHRHPAAAIWAATSSPSAQLDLGSAHRAEEAHREHLRVGARDRR